MKANRSPKTDDRSGRLLQRIWQLPPLLLISGCYLVSSAPPEVYRVEGHGILAVSSFNEMMAANRAVDAMAKGSPTARNFFDKEGRPTAIQALYSALDVPTIRLYYPGRGDYFTATYSSDDWAIFGPEPISLEETAIISDRLGIKSTRSQNSREFSPPAGTTSPAGTNQPAWASPSPSALGGAAQSGEIGQPSNLSERDLSGSNPPTDPLSAGTDPYPSDSYSVAAPHAAGIQASASASVAARGIQPELPAIKSGSSSIAAGTGTTKISQGALDALIHSQGKEPAETTPKGDLVHYVISEGETMEAINLWYTKDPENLSRLIRVNALPDPDQLSVGDMIIVPRYMVRNGLRLTEPALRAMQK